MKDQAVFSPYDRVLRYLLPIIPRALKPNHVTFFRLIFSPVLIILLLGEQYLISLFVFIFLAFTDMLDGAMARLRGEITEWGKIWDPIADKILVGEVILFLLFKTNPWLASIIIALELSFILGGFWIKYKNPKLEISANTYGKIKMNLQCFGAGFLFLGYIKESETFLLGGQILLGIAIIFAVISLIKKGI